MNLLNRMFQEDPDHRLTIQEVLKHPYMQGPTYTKDQVDTVMRHRLGGGKR